MNASIQELKYLQSLPLADKVKITQIRIKEWYEHFGGQVYVSFSGGKDSTVLYKLVHEMYPEVPAVFVDTGLEFPEIKQFVKQCGNTIILKPKMTYRQVLDKYGYPIVSKENAQKIHDIRTTKSAKLLHKRLNGNGTRWKSGKLPNKWKYLIDAPFKISHKCCDVMKKQPAKKYSKESSRKGMLGTMTEDSRYRFQSYIRHGCNAFDLKEPMSRPLMPWREKDVWQFIKAHGVPYCKIYDMGYRRTGCVFCGFGAHMEKAGEHRFIRLKQTHPKLYNHCMNGLGMKQVLEEYGVPY